MKSLALLSILSLAAAVFPAGRARADDPFRSFAIQQAGKLLADPPLFFYEFQRNMETTTPLPPGRRFGAHYHMLGGLLIVPLPDFTTAGNLSAKLRLHPEGRLLPGLPQLDVAGGYWDSYLTSLVEQEPSPGDTETKVTRADLNGSYMAAILTSSLEPQVRLFWSYKYSRLNLDIGLSQKEDIFGTQVDSFAGGMEEHTLSAGIEHRYGNDRYWTLEGGYGLVNKLLTAKVAWSRRFVEVGLNVYPESVFIMQPQVNFHVFF